MNVHVAQEVYISIYTPYLLNWWTAVSCKNGSKPQWL